MRRYNDNIFVGSHDYHINYYTYDKDKLFLEFSLPKYFYGHNIDLLYPSQLEQCLAGVHRELLDHFGLFPHYKNWYVQRLDLCYAWRFGNQPTAERVLNSLKQLEYPRKVRLLYKTGVIWKGEKYSTKFYLKQDDFRVHDFKRIVKSDPERAYQLLNLSSGVLRFEVTFHKFALDYLFENKKEITYIDLLKNNFILNTLKEYMSKLVKNFDKEIIDDLQIAKKFISIYGKIVGMRRYSFYELYFSPEINKRNVLNNLYSRQTIWRYKRDIEKADINILPLFDIDTNIHILSEYVVNPDPSAVAPATSS